MKSRLRRKRREKPGKVVSEFSARRLFTMIMPGNDTADSSKS